jgi:hypothetical protein
MNSRKNQSFETILSDQSQGKYHVYYFLVRKSPEIDGDHGRIRTGYSDSNRTNHSPEYVSVPESEWNLSN